MKRRPSWLLPIVFLLGYLFAWGMILLDRHMLIEEQRLLQEEIDQVRTEQKVISMIDVYNEDYIEQVEWNSNALEETVQGEKEEQ